MNQESVIESDISSLWQAYKVTGDTALKHKLIDQYIGVARRHAAAIYKLRPNNAIEYSDYYHFAVIGLLEAIGSYKYELNSYFPAFAKHRIRGAVFDGLARMTEKANQLSQESRHQQRLLSFMESDDDSSELFDEMVDLSISLAISSVLDIHDAQPPKLLDYGNHEIAELQELLKICIDKLPRDERMVVNYHYFHDVDFVVIAEIMNLTKGRISQLHKKAVTQIRNFYENELNIDASF